MRKLKLQMQMTIDGFVAGSRGQLDWMANMGEDQQLLALINQLTDTSDTILLGRKMTSGFILGTLTAGKEADVVLLEGNPLEDISASRRVRHVFKGGKHYTPEPPVPPLPW